MFVASVISGFSIRESSALGAISVIGCIVFFLSLKPVTQVGFVVWNLIGVAIYLLWSSKNSRLAKGEEEAA